MFRKFITQLQQWELDKDKEPLLVIGARQVGKTWLIKEFCKQTYSDYVYINFEERNDYSSIFEGSLSPKDILKSLSILIDRTITEETAIFFDEIQLCERAITSLKYFCEAEENYRIICAGSLLGVKLNRFEGSFPVGKVIIKHMYPLDFEEFIRNIGVTNEVIASVREAWEQQIPVDAYIHEKMMRLFNLYLIVGGMPAAVQKYVDTNDLQLVIREQKAILTLYKKDIAKYDPNNKLYINDIFELIPSELNAKNKRFILKNLNEHIKFSRHENSFVWLRDADMALPTYNVEEPRVPLKLNELRNLFKLFQNDVGLLASQYVGGIQLQILQGDVCINNGAIYENAVAQELHAHGWNLYYFNSKKQGEVDFLLEQDAEVIPLEVKSGKDYQRHVALTNLLANDEYGIKRAIVLSNSNVEVRGTILYAPVYMTMFLHHRPSDRPMIYHPELP